MSLPALMQDWDNTIRGLHLAAQVLGAARIVALPHDPLWLELALKPVTAGLSTDRLSAGGEVVLSFGRAALVYYGAGGEQVIPLHGTTQRGLLDALLPLLADHDLPQLQSSSAVGTRYSASAQDNLLDSLRDTIHEKGHTLLAQDTPEQHEAITINAETARDYGVALNAVFGGMARFRAHLKGHMSPIVVFSEHFDLSTLWFVEGDMDEHKAHLNFGFAPFSSGLPRPYLYAYAYPYPPDAVFPPLPAPARWHFEGWTGVVVDYDALTSSDNPEAVIEALCEGIYVALHPLISG